MVDLPRSDVPARTADQPGGTRTGAPAGRPAAEPEYTTWTEDTLSGWAVFSGVLVGLVALFQIMTGIVALAGSDYFRLPTRALAVDVSYTTWGWTHLIIGLVMLVTAVGLAFGGTWARVLGVAFAVLSGIVNLAFMPAAPFVATVVIAIDVFLIYAITVHGGASRQGR